MLKLLLHVESLPISPLSLMKTIKNTPGALVDYFVVMMMAMPTWHQPTYSLNSKIWIWIYFYWSSGSHDPWSEILTGSSWKSYVNISLGELHLHQVTQKCKKIVEQYRPLD